MSDAPPHRPVTPYPVRSGEPPFQSIPVLRVRSTLASMRDGPKLRAMTPLSTAKHGPAHHGAAELLEERHDESAPSVRDLRNHRDHFRSHLPRFSRVPPGRTPGRPSRRAHRNPAVTHARCGLALASHRDPRSGGLARRGFLAPRTFVRVTIALFPSEYLTWRELTVRGPTRTLHVSCAVSLGCTARGDH